MFTETFFPRFGETDACGHINNTVLPIWMEHARNPILRIFEPSFDPKKWNSVIAHIETDFIAQMHVDKEVVAKTWVSKVGNSSMEVYQEFWQGEVLGATGKSVIIHFDFSKQKSQPIPAYIKDQLMQHMKEA